MPAGTIYALSSGRPPAAVAIIRISGPEAHMAGLAFAGDLPRPREAAVRILRDPRGGGNLDEALVLRFDAPASATGEDVVEFQCHGSRAVVDAVLASLAQIEGLREALPGEFTRRAFENGRIDLTEAEGLADLLEAETESQRRAALLLAEGGLRRVIAAWEGRLLALSAASERAIDYAEEDEDAADTALSASARELASELAEWLERPRAEPLRGGVRVVAAGPPNAGKSSLINAIAEQERVIVSAVAGTTRDVVEVPVALNGIPFLFIDTAGMRETGDEIEALGIGRARGEIDKGDIVIWLGRPDEVPIASQTLLVHAKCDIAGPTPQGSLAVSAQTGAGIDGLLAEIIRRAERLIPAEGLVALNRRQAEIITQLHACLMDAASATDPVLQAENFRAARQSLDRLTGRAGIEPMLDALFARFCLGK